MSLPPDQSALPPPIAPLSVLRDPSSSHHPDRDPFSRAHHPQPFVISPTSPPQMTLRVSSSEQVMPRLKSDEEAGGEAEARSLGVVEFLEGLDVAGGILARRGTRKSDTLRAANSATSLGGGEGHLEFIWKNASFDRHDEKNVIQAVQLSSTPTGIPPATNKSHTTTILTTRSTSQSGVAAEGEESIWRCTALRGGRFFTVIKQERIAVASGSSQETREEAQTGGQAGFAEVARPAVEGGVEEEEAESPANVRRNSSTRRKQHERNRDNDRRKDSGVFHIENNSNPDLTNPPAIPLPPDPPTAPAPASTTSLSTLSPTSTLKTLKPSSHLPLPNPNSRWSPIPHASPEVVEHIALFSSVAWAEGPLGDPEGWEQSLLTMVEVCLASPFPVLLAWGPRHVMLYNEPYSRVIGAKHPKILGMPYDEAWPEVWPQLQPVVASAQNGEVVHVDDQQMFLNRGDLLEETYFTWSMIPVRGATGDVDGIFIPNFDRTNAVINNRRIRHLHDISRQISVGTTPAQVIQSLCYGLAANSTDLNYVLLYTTVESEEGDYATGASIGDASAQGSGSSEREQPMRSRKFSTMSDEAIIEFSLLAAVGSISADNADIVPNTFVSDKSKPLDGERGLKRWMRQAHISDDMLIVQGEDAQMLDGSVQENAFGDMTGSVAVLPIRASNEDRLYGIMVVGLNTRLYMDDEYRNFLGLVRVLIATGLASVKAHLEEMQKATFLAALNRRKNEELQTLLKAKTEELRRAELQFSSAFEVSPVGIWIASPEGDLQYLNPAYLHLSGLSNTDDYTAWIDHVHPDEREAMNKAFKNCLTTSITEEFRFLTGELDANGEPATRWVEASGQPIRTPDGAVEFCTGAMMDITERKKNEMFQTRRAEDALAMRRQLEQFIDFTSHELRNPLSAICMAMESVVDRLNNVGNQGPVLDSAMRDVIEDANVVTLCTKHMRRLVDDVLSLSKIDSDMMVIANLPCRPLEVIREVTRMYHAEMLSKGISCSISRTTEYFKLVDWVKTDAQWVKTLCINLMTNAIKFTVNSKVKEVTIRLDARIDFPEEARRHADFVAPAPSDASDRGIYLIVSVQDTGKGISAGEASRLFQRFQQGNRTAVNYQGGSGLGLFICKKLANRLGGDIYLESAPGKGSTFTFFIRVERCESAASSNSDAGRSSTGSDAGNSGSTRQSPIDDIRETAATPPSEIADKIRNLTSLASTPSQQQPREKAYNILLTEDNLINQQLLQRQLVKLGCRVSIANDGLEALTHYRKHFAADEGDEAVFDCVLMDIEMPNMGGMECTREIRKLEAASDNKPRLAIIAVTANARHEQMQEMLNAGMDSAVAKPFSSKSLMTRIKEVVDEVAQKGR